MFKPNQEESKLMFANISIPKQDFERQKMFRQQERSISPVKVSPMIKTQSESPLKEMLALTLSNQKLKEQTSYTANKLSIKDPKSAKQSNIKISKQELFAFKVNQNIQEAYKKMIKQDDQNSKTPESAQKIPQVRKQNFMKIQNLIQRQEEQQQLKTGQEPIKVKGKNNIIESQIENFKKIIENKKQEGNLRNVPVSPKNPLQNQIQDLRSITLTLKNQLNSYSNFSQGKTGNSLSQKQINPQQLSESYLLKLQENMHKKVQQNALEHAQNASISEFHETEQKSFNQ